MGRETGELRHLGETEAVGVGCVDAADERVDETLVDLVAEAGPYEASDAVGFGRRAREERLDRGAGLAPGREQPGARQREGVAGDAEDEPVGDVVEPVLPDGGSHPLRVDEIVAQSHLVGQRRRVGHAGEVGVGGAVDGIQPRER